MDQTQQTNIETDIEPKLLSNQEYEEKKTDSLNDSLPNIHQNPIKIASSQSFSSEKSVKKFQYNLEKQCYICKKLDDLFLCSRCKLVYYCDQKCQKKDWNDHKDYCLPIEKQPNYEHINLDHFKDLKKIGEGNFSDIYSALNLFDKKTYAIKIINKAKLARVRKEADILMERYCLKKLNDNPYVIDIYSTFQDDLNLFLHLEFVKGGELWDIVKIFGLESVSLVKYFFAQIFLAVESIHNLGIVHRDLKLENILIDEDKNVKLVDFGTAKDMLNPEMKGSGNSAKGKKVFENFVGTPNFMAPECIRNKNSDYRSDVWSLGCILFQLVNGFPPYMGGSDYLIFQKSINEDPIFPEEIFPEILRDLILWMLKKVPEERPTLEMIKTHKFFENVDFSKIRNNYKLFEEKISPEENFWKKIKGTVLSENIVLMKKEELTKIMEKILNEIQDNLIFEGEAKKKAESKCKNLEKQFAHFYKLYDYEY